MTVVPRNSWGWLLAAAAAFAVAEIGAGIALGFFAWGRAEPLLFIAVRPWLLLVVAVAVAHRSWRKRGALYILALSLAGVSESLLLLGLGGEPWPDLARGWAAGALIALGADLLAQLGLRVAGRWGRAAAALAGVALLLLPGALGPYEAIVLGPAEPRSVDSKPDLILMTGLPIVWGESGPFDPASRPAAAYAALQREFDVRPIDYIDASSLADGGLLLLAQPRTLEPAELAALDAWVRGGGRALILADPTLVWPSRVPLGDVRRPPPVTMLSPLLAHWGVRVEPEAGDGVRWLRLRDGEAVRRLTIEAPGRFTAEGRECRTGLSGFIAACAIGGGRALLVADADLLRDALWTAPGRRGAEHLRSADNAVIVAGWLDRLAGIDRPRAARPAQWIAPEADRVSALILAALPLLFALAAGALVYRRP